MLILKDLSLWAISGSFVFVFVWNMEVEDVRLFTVRFGMTVAATVSFVFAVFLEAPYLCSYCYCNGGGIEKARNTVGRWD